MSGNSSEKEIWYKRWYFVPLLPATLFFALLICSAVFPTIPIEAAVPVMIISATASLSWLIEKHWTKTSELIEKHGTKTSKLIKKELESDLGKIASHLDQPYLAFLRDELFLHMKQSLHQLVGQGRAILTVEGCTKELVKLIDNMDAEQHDEILAVCGQKEWDSPEVARYYKKNYEKSKKNVKVRRIFLQEEDKEFTKGEKNVLREHLSSEYPNVEARVIFSKDLKKYLTQYNIPNGFGFAILGDVVLVHWGLGKNLPEAGRKLDHPWFVELHKQIFDRLWEISKGEKEEDIKRIRKEILGESLE